MPTYDGVSRISITSTHIEIFGDSRVREPLIGLNVDVHCGTARVSCAAISCSSIRPRKRRHSLSNGTRGSCATTAATVSATTASRDRRSDGGSPVTRAAHANASPRARGQTGGTVTQGQTYRVVRGDTLSGIAARVAERSTTILATADAIFAANPQAFTRGNPDLIKEGRSITIPVMTPSTATLAATSAPAPLPAVREAALPTAAFVPTADSAACTGERSATAARRRAARSSLRSNPTASRADTVVEPSAAPVPAATRTDVTTEAPSQATTARASPWLTALLALGAAILLSVPLAFIRRRKQQAAARAHGERGRLRSRDHANRSIPSPASTSSKSTPRASGDDKIASTTSSIVAPVASAGVAAPAGLDDVVPTGPIDPWTSTSEHRS